MTFRKFGKSIFLKAILVFITLFAASFCMVKEWYLAELIIVPIIIFQFFDYYNFHKKAQSEVQQFVESVQYRDFSRNFDVIHAPSELQPFRSGFNEINSAFKIISKEKETQYLHLKTILEIVDTGILSYETESGEVLWMNESLKTFLLTPYLKTIHSLGKRNSRLYEEIINLSPGKSMISSLQKDNSSFKILLSATAFQTENKKYKLVAFQNINEVLDENESIAWQKLLNVMTHEIMNSIAPISSLANTLNNRLNQNETMNSEKEYSVLFEDMKLGIDTIKRRSEGLLKFAETYRNLNKISQLNLTNIYVRNLFENLSRLMEPTFEQKNIELEIFLRETNLFFNIDSDLIEQVLINLIINAIEAVKDVASPKIILSAEESEQDKVVIKVSDNGIGISPEQMEKIFIPFYTSRKNGTGIGLSLCKQIMAMHKGTIKVQSIEGKGSVFILQFN